MATNDPFILDEDTLKVLKGEKKKRRKKDLEKLAEKCRKLVGNSKNFLEEYLECIRLGGKLPNKKKVYKRRKKKIDTDNTEDPFLSLNADEIIVNED